MGKYVLGELEESARNYQQAQTETLLKILHDNSNTEYGKKHDFSSIHSMEEYKKSVPITEYQDYAAYIERMLKKKEEHLITAYPVKYYLLSSGTTGSEKYIPMTEPAIIKYALYSYRCAYDMVEEHYKKGESKEEHTDCSCISHTSPWPSDGRCNGHRHPWTG